MGGQANYGAAISTTTGGITGGTSSTGNNSGEEKWYNSFANELKSLGKQILLGKFTEEVTLVGTVGQIGLALMGVDAPADLRDIYYDVSHWEWSWSHALETTVDAMALLPVVGLIKCGDEVGTLVKNGSKFEVVKIAENVAEFVNRLKNIADDILGVMESLGAHIIHYLIRGKV